VHFCSWNNPTSRRLTACLKSFLPLNWGTQTINHGETMTEVQTADGLIVTDLPAEAVADLEVKAPETAPPAAPEEGKQPEANPTEEPKAPEAPQEPQKPAEPEGKTPEVKPKKAGPIADLLAKKHEADARAEAAEAKAKDLEAKLAQISAQPASPEATDKIKALAEKYGLEPEVLSDIVSVAREGMNPNPELPKEVQDLIAERAMEKAQANELNAFNKRVDSLAKAIPGEPIAQHKDKLLELAYSDEVAPDGERYADKELAEIYFKFIKPEVEPGKASGELNPTSGTKAAAPVLDFQDIFDRDDPKDVENMDEPTFKKYSAWLNEHGGDVKITRK
jgi:hypothetical protein